MTYKTRIKRIRISFYPRVVSQGKLLYFANRTPTISLINARCECRQCFVILDIRASITPIYIHTGKYIDAVVKSPRELLFYSILKHKNSPFLPSFLPPSALCASIFFRVELPAFFGTVIVGYYSCYLSKRAPSWSIPSHERSRITYISPRVCWRARIRTIEPPQNNSQE